MTLFPPFDIPTIEHLQGYLFSQESIANEIGASPGGMYEFKIYTIQNNEDKPLKELIVDKIFQQLKCYLNYQAEEAKLKELLLVFANFDKISNSENRFVEVMDEWFVDKYLSVDRLQSRNGKKPFSLYFYHLILYFLGHNFDYYEFQVSKELKSDPDYPWHMNLAWGMDFNIFIFKNEIKTLFLHVGFVIT